MIAWAFPTFLLLAAPDDAAARLRTAWASQYEWREDGIENATIGFRYRYRWQGHEDEEQRPAEEGRAQIVAVGREIVRSHFPGAAEGRREQLVPHLEWVLGRFARDPFEEHFKDMQFDGPETTDDGLERIVVTGEKGRHCYVLDKDRLVGLEWQLGSRDQPTFNRRRYTVGDLGGGYAILGEEESWDLGEKGKTHAKRHLTAGKSDRHPYPGAYRYVSETQGGAVTIEIDFEPPTVNSKDPLVGDSAARDLLEAAWSRRYALPKGLRLQAEFQRRIDKDLEQAYWYETVKGTLQIWGMDDIQFILDEGVLRNPDATYLLKRRLEGHFQWLVWLLRERAFAAEFKGCGFALAADGDATIVQIFGHERALAFRVEKGLVAGYLENTADGDRWCRFRLRKVKGDLARIESISVAIDGRRLKLAIHYRRHGGVEVPVEFEAVGWGYGERSGIFGIAKYLFKKIEVTRAP